MQAPYKEQKASNTVHLPLYWNMLSFSFTIIEFSLDINFRVAMHVYLVFAEPFRNRFHILPIKRYFPQEMWFAVNRTNIFLREIFFIGKPICRQPE